MNKFIALFALVAVAFAEPEADPQVFYGYQPYVTGYVPAVHQSVGYTKYANGAVVPADTPSVAAAKVQHHTAKAVEYAKKGYVPYTTLGYGLPHYIAKREADSQFYTGYNVPAYTGYSGLYNYASTYTVPSYTGYSGYYNPYSLGYRFKREADSEAQYYTGYSGYTLPYSGYTGYSSVYRPYTTAYTGYSNLYRPYSVYGF